jgi:hypothetical protein
LVTASQLVANEDGRPAAWIEPPATDREPNPPHGYVVSFIHFHERGFTAPASSFLRGLCFHYGVELHNFAPNAISQAATLVGVCEGFLGIPVNWDLWIYLFHAELHTATTPEPKTRRAVRAGGVMIAVRETRRELYIPCTMTSNNTEWEQGWFYLHNDEPGMPPWTGKVVKEKADSWGHGLSPSSRQVRLASPLKVLKALADNGLTAASVLANLHHRRIVPLMERWLRIFEMRDEADPVALAQSRLLPDLLLPEYAATRARRAINLRAMRVDDTALWAFTMLPEGPLVSGFPTPPSVFRFVKHRHDLGFCSSLAGGGCERRVVRPAHAPSPSTRARRSGESRSGRRARRSGVSGDGSAENRGARSSGCASSMGSPPLGLRSTRRWTRRRRMRAMGVGLPPRGGSLRSLRPEPRRRGKRRRLGRAQEHPPPGILRERRRALRRRWCALRRWLGAKRWLRRRRLQRLPSPRGRGNEGFPPRGRRLLPLSRVF